MRVPGPCRLPVPMVVETEGEPAWQAWDHAVRQLDRNTPEGRAALAGDIA